MAMRLVLSEPPIRIHKCSITGEYRVRIYKDGKPYPPADYFTDDYKDAVLTLQQMRLEEME
jgi:hypothetical protein